MLPVVGRRPWCIIGVPIVIHCWTMNESWLNDVLSTIDKRVSDDLSVVVAFNNYCCHILIGIQSVHVLNNDDVCSAGDLLDNAQVIDISVAIEVEVTDLAGVVVEEPFKFFHCASFGKGYCHGLQVEVVTQVVC